MPKYVLGPDGNPLPPPPPPAPPLHSSAAHQRPLSRPSDHPRPPLPQRSQNNGSFRVGKHSRSESNFDPQKLAQGLERNGGGLLRSEGSSSEETLQPNQYGQGPPAPFPIQQPMQMHMNGPYGPPVSTSFLYNDFHMLRSSERSGEVSPRTVKHEAVTSNDEHRNGASDNGQYQSSLQPAQMKQRASCCSNNAVPSRQKSSQNLSSESRSRSSQASTLVDCSGSVPSTEWVHPMQSSINNGTPLQERVDSTVTHVPDGTPPSTVPPGCQTRFPHPISLPETGMQSDGWDVKELPDGPFIPGYISLSRLGSDTQLCACGAGCDCLMCPQHPYNKVSMHHMSELGAFLHDTGGTPNNPFPNQDSLVSPTVSEGLSQELFNTFPNGMQSPPFRPDASCSSVSAHFPNELSSMSQNRSQVMPVNPFNPSDWRTVQYDVPSCSDLDGTCMCDGDCMCVGCLTHKPDIGPSPVGAQPDL